MIKINLTTLSDVKKQFAWSWLQHNKPDLAKLLGKPDVRLAQKTFNASIVIELEPSELEDLKKKSASCAQQGV